MIAAILRAQLLSMRVRRGARRGGVVFSAITALFFYLLFGFMAWGAMLFFSSADAVSYFIPALSGGLLFVLLYWQLAPLISASFGSSLDLRKLLAYPIPHNQLFTVEIILRITTCTEMLILVGGAAIGLLRNPLFGAAASPGILAGAIFFCASNILLSAGTRNALERWFQRARMREIVMFFILAASVAPRLMMYLRVKKSALLPFIPAQPVWPWSAPAHLMLRDNIAVSGTMTLFWLGIAYVFSRWQFERGIRYDQTQPVSKAAAARKGESPTDRLFAFPSRFLKDPVAALVEKELRTLWRIPRFRMVYLMSCVFGMVLFLPALTRNRTPSQFMQQAGLPLMALYGLLMLGQITFWNSLGFDRSAVQGYFSWPVRFRDVLIAKNITVLSLMVPQILVISLAVQVIHLHAGPGKILETLIVMAIAAMYWLAMGNICSVRMPRALDPTKMNQMSNKLQTLTILFAPFLLIPLVLAYWCRWFFESDAIFAGIVVVAGIIGGIVYWVGLDSASQSAQVRREAIITELSQGDGPLSIT